VANAFACVPLSSCRTHAPSYIVRWWGSTEVYSTSEQQTANPHPLCSPRHGNSPMHALTSSWHRSPPPCVPPGCLPCALQCPPFRACFEQPSSSHCRLPMALLQAQHGGCRRNPNALKRAIHSRHPPPLSPHRSASAHRTPYTRGGSARAGQTLRMSRSRWSTALGRGTYGGCVVGEDGQGLLRTLLRQVRRLLARRAASPSQSGHPTPAARRPQHDGGTPWSEPAALRVGLREVRGCVSQNLRCLATVQVGVAAAVHGTPLHTPIPSHGDFAPARGGRGRGHGGHR
jgi:hypothetical protein